MNQINFVLNGYDCEITVLFPLLTPDGLNTYCREMEKIRWINHKSRYD